LCLPFARIQLLVRNKQTAKSLSSNSMQALLRQSEKTGGLGFLEASQGVASPTPTLGFFGRPGRPGAPAVSSFCKS
jgi:hypothetical protein